MTLPEATRKCLIAYHDELPERFKWREGTVCSSVDIDGICYVHLCEVNASHHAVPMPEPSDELAMALLRILHRRGHRPSIEGWDGATKPWRVLLYLGHPTNMSVITMPHVDDPRDAIIFACAELADKVRA